MYIHSLDLPLSLSAQEDDMHGSSGASLSLSLSLSCFLSLSLLFSLPLTSLFPPVVVFECGTATSIGGEGGEAGGDTLWRLADAAAVPLLPPGAPQHREQRRPARTQVLMAWIAPPSAASDVEEDTARCLDMLVGDRRATACPLRRHGGKAEHADIE